MTPERRSKIEQLINHKQNDLTVVLENVMDPHNISAVMRTCEAVGIMEIYVIKTKMPTKRRWNDSTSASANRWMYVHHFEDIVSCFEVIKNKYKNIWCTHLSKAAKGLYSLDLTQSTALVFGNESEGVSEEALSFCNGNFIIPQVGIIQSLNISVACAISLYEAYRQKFAAGHYENYKLNEQERMMLLKHWQLENFDESL
ncbi:MAG: RNA methyltransferase [Chitinophagaceae bacterium]|nr:MAG: tRNA/rRNA methyltransferase SpoU [Bacteroidetes bacterium OLB11]MCC6448900.1 RNA methyltransferase [Chitinophagaceae bacterium]HMN32758.1 RNA methyltransferase [Chitinophagaceae bacterium]